MNTTIEQLNTETDSYGAVLAYGNLVLATKLTWTKAHGYGNDARLYRRIEEPIPGWGENSRSAIECRLELIATAEHLFEDAGHAIEWAFTQAATLTK